MKRVCRQDNLAYAIVCVYIIICLYSYLRFACLDEINVKSERFVVAFHKTNQWYIFNQSQETCLILTMQSYILPTKVLQAFSHVTSIAALWLQDAGKCWKSATERLSLIFLQLFTVIIIEPRKLSSLSSINHRPVYIQCICFYYPWKFFLYRVV